MDSVKTRYPTAKIILGGMQVPPSMGQRYTRQFGEIFPRLAKKNEAGLIPFVLQGVGGEPELNLPDGIHPTPEGHKIVAENVWKELEKYLEKPVNP
jgi:acyl-CoA thioesterase-1